MSELIRDSTKKMMKRVLSRCIRMGYLIWLLSNFLLTLRSEDEPIYALTMPTSC